MKIKKQKQTMKKIFIAIVLVSIVISCKKKGVKLPKVPLNGKEKMENYSSIWFFNENGKLNLNQNNRISSTHWLFNIDKNLPISEVFPTVTKMIRKHNEKSPHKTEGTNNYFSYANANTDKLNFYQIDSITYKITKKVNLPKFKALSDTILITVENPNFTTKETFKNKILQIAFKGTLSFQNYMQVKAALQKEKRTISKTEYIF